MYRCLLSCLCVFSFPCFLVCFPYFFGVLFSVLVVVDSNAQWIRHLSASPKFSESFCLVSFFESSQVIPRRIRLLSSQNFPFFKSQELKILSLTPFSNVLVKRKVEKLEIFCVF